MTAVVEPIKHRLAQQLKHRRAPKPQEVKLYDDKHTPLAALMGVFDVLMPLALEWHAPVPKGLSPGMQAAVQGQKADARLRFERQLGLVTGYANALVSADLIPVDQLHDVLAAMDMLAKGHFPEPEAEPAPVREPHCTHPKDSWADCNGHKQCQECGHFLTNDEIFEYERAKGVAGADVDTKKPALDDAPAGSAG